MSTDDKPLALYYLVMSAIFGAMTYWVFIMDHTAGIVIGVLLLLAFALGAWLWWKEEL